MQLGKRKQTGRCGLEERSSVDATAEIEQGLRRPRLLSYTTFERRGYLRRTQVKQIRDYSQVH